MKGDFSRNTFDPVKNFTQVLMQQGRVTVDADANEQAAIFLHHLRTLTRDLLGPFSSPEVGGVKVSVDPSVKNKKLENLVLSAGRIYVDGILLEIADPDPVAHKGVTKWSYEIQPYLPKPSQDDILAQAAKDNAFDESHLLILDVWERLVTSLEDGSIREVALGGPDTAVRTQAVWQMKAIELAPRGLTEDEEKHLAGLKKERDKLAKDLEKASATAKPDIQEKINALDLEITAIDRKGKALPDCQEAVAGLSNLSTGQMAARVDPGEVDDSPCVVPPDSRYRGAENQLYRVEIHAGGKAFDPAGAGGAAAASFKWGRDNGSLVTPWLGSRGEELMVGRTRGFAARNWVELSYDELEFTGEPGILVQLAKVEGDVLTVDPATIPAGKSLAWDEDLGHPKVRRWDQVQAGDVVLNEGAIPLTESANDDGWVDLEDGVQVRFVPGGEYRTGDYWMFPARVATGDIEWPRDSKGVELAVRPHGVEHHYASLGKLKLEDDQWELEPCDCMFQPITECDD